MIAATGFVLLMTIPGLSLFYCGMVRKKNVLNSMALCLVPVMFVSLLWAALGYTLAFTGEGPVLGTLDRLFLRDMGMDSVNAAAKTIPESLFMLYQMTFAIITVALVSGAVVDRMRFSAFLAFGVIWLFVVYVPLAHWVWGGGFLQSYGLLDFAGGTVVHINAGVAGLVAALVVGKRRGYGTDNMAPYDLSMAVVGTGLLWVGWFGFNGGSALGANSRASMAIVATHLAASTGALLWMAMEWKTRGKPSVLGMISGAIAGLGTITPASGFVLPWQAVIIGGSPASSASMPAHGSSRSSATMTRSTCSACTASVERSAPSSPACSRWRRFRRRRMRPAHPACWKATRGSSGFKSAGAAVTIVWSGAMTWVILKVVGFLVPLRVSDEDERMGLDIRLHGELIHT